jgi:hypothetical protein
MRYDVDSQYRDASGFGELDLCSVSEVMRYRVSFSHELKPYPLLIQKFPSNNFRRLVDERQEMHVYV